MEQAVSAATLNGLTELQQLGLAGVLGSFLLLGLGIAIWHCETRRRADQEARQEEARINREAYQAEAKANREVLSGATEAINGVRVTLAEMKGRLEK